MRNHKRFLAALLALLLLLGGCGDAASSAASTSTLETEMSASSSAAASEGTSSSEVSEAPRPEAEMSYEAYFAEERLFLQPEAEDYGSNFYILKEDRSLWYRGQTPARMVHPGPVWDDSSDTLETVPGQKMITVVGERQDTLVIGDQRTGEVVEIYTDPLGGLSHPHADDVVVFFVRDNREICRLHLPSGQMDRIAEMNRHDAGDILYPLSNVAVRWYEYTEAWLTYATEQGIAPEENENAPYWMDVSKLMLANSLTGETIWWDSETMGDFHYEIGNFVVVKPYEAAPIPDSILSMPADEYNREERPFCYEPAGRIGYTHRFPLLCRADGLYWYQKGSPTLYPILSGSVSGYLVVEADRMIVVADHRILQTSPKGGEITVLWEDAEPVSLYDIGDVVLYVVQNQHTVYRIHEPTGTAERVYTSADPILGIAGLSNQAFQIWTEQDCYGVHLAKACRLEAVERDDMGWEYEI